MLDPAGIILTSFVTVLIFVTGRLVDRIFLEPIQEQRRLIGHITQAVISQRCIVKDTAGNPYSDDEIERARDTIQDLSGKFRSTCHVLPNWSYACLERIGLVLKRETVRAVSLQLDRWALFMSQNAVNDASKRISESLSLGIASEWDEFEESMSAGRQS